MVPIQRFFAREWVHYTMGMKSDEVRAYLFVALEVFVNPFQARRFLAYHT